MRGFPLFVMYVSHFLFCASVKVKCRDYTKLCCILCSVTAKPLFFGSVEW